MLPNLPIHSILDIQRSTKLLNSGHFLSHSYVVSTLDSVYGSDELAAIKLQIEWSSNTSLALVECQTMQRVLALYSIDHSKQLYFDEEFKINNIVMSHNARFCFLSKCCSVKGFGCHCNECEKDRPNIYLAIDPNHVVAQIARHTRTSKANQFFTNLSSNCTALSTVSQLWKNKLPLCLFGLGKRSFAFPDPTGSNRILDLHKLLPRSISTDNISDSVPFGHSAVQDFSASILQSHLPNHQATSGLNSNPMAIHSTMQCVLKYQSEAHVDLVSSFTISPSDLEPSKFALESHNPNLSIHSDDPTSCPPTSSEAVLCRFCLDDCSTGSLISPCLCIGSAKFVHLHCLQRWRKTASNPYSRVRCEICHAYYRLGHPLSGKFTIDTAKICCVVGYLFYAVIALYIFRWGLGILGARVNGTCSSHLLDVLSLGTFWHAIIRWQILTVQMLSRIGPSVLLVVVYFSFQDDQPQNIHQPQDQQWFSSMRIAAFSFNLLIYWLILDFLCHAQFSTIMCAAADSMYILCTLVGVLVLVYRSNMWANIMAPSLLVLLVDVNVDVNDVRFHSY
ncbi:hypothetical protein QVD99_000136 [Batrachochytrium dendrobatidis]|nr:hypothetical protein QVD99_000136 [Batrachochytrium dendrobatidis]